MCQKKTNFDFNFTFYIFIGLWYRPKLNCLLYVRLMLIKDSPGFNAHTQKYMDSILWNSMSQILQKKKQTFFWWKFIILQSYGGDLLFAPQQIARDFLFLLGQIWLFNVYVAYVSCTPQVHCVLVIRIPYINRVT